AGARVPARRRAQPVAAVAPLVAAAARARDRECGRRAVDRDGRRGRRRRAGRAAARLPRLAAGARAARARAALPRRHAVAARRDAGRLEGQRHEDARAARAAGVARVHRTEARMNAFAIATAKERQLDWLLGEVLGATAARTRAIAPSTARWLVAALITLALG